MSTKIYNGCRLKKTIAGAHRALLALQPHALAIAQREHDIMIAIQVVEAERRGEKLTPAMAHCKVLDMLRQNPRQAFPGLDFDFEVALFPNVNNTLCIPYTRERKLGEWFRSLPFYEEYGYWSNEDGPEGVTPQEWGKRRKTWDRMLPGLGIPAKTSLGMWIVKNEWLSFASPREWPDLKAEASRLLEERDAKESRGSGTL
jgi:hypothetical protein